MSGLSRRFAPHLVALGAVALAAVAVHAWVGLERDDCARPEAFLRPEDADSPRQRFMRAAFAASAWREGRIASDALHASISWAIVRSFQPRRLYYQPEMALFSARPTRRSVEWREDGSERLPVHRVWYRPDPSSGASFQVSYLLIYRGEPVANPVRAQLEAAPVLFARGAAPMTLLIVGANSPAGEVEQTEALAQDWLAASWRSYRFACEE